MALISTNISINIHIIIMNIRRERKSLVLLLFLLRIVFITTHIKSNNFYVIDHKKADQKDIPTKSKHDGCVNIHKLNWMWYKMDNICQASWIYDTRDDTDSIKRKLNVSWVAVCEDMMRSRKEEKTLNGLWFQKSSPFILLLCVFIHPPL